MVLPPELRGSCTEPLTSVPATIDSILSLTKDAPWPETPGIGGDGALTNASRSGTLAGAYRLASISPPSTVRTAPVT